MTKLAENNPQGTANIADDRVLGAVRTKFKCVVCGKITAGRLPVQNKERGDGTFYYPRRHYIDGKLCDGVFQGAEWVDV